MGADDTPHGDLDVAEVKRVLDAALLTRRVFSRDALSGLQPASDRKSGVKQLKTSGAQALFLLTLKPGLTVNEVASELNITQPGASFAITRLMEGNFVRAWINPEDKRLRHHAATAAGRQCIQEILERAEIG